MSFSEWKEVKLRDITSKITKGTTPTTLGASFVESGVNYIKSECITASRLLDRSKYVYITEETHEKLKRSQIVTNDILFSMAGMFLGKTGIVFEHDIPANTNQAVAIIRVVIELADYKYIYYYLSQKIVQDYVNGSTSQSAQPNINLKQIGDINITIPPLPEQKAIADTLSCLDDKIELNNRINKTLEEMAQAIFKSWFVDFEPFQDGEFEDSELGMIPKGWKVDSLEEYVISIDNRGKTPPLVTQMTPYPIIDVKALSGESRIIDYNNCTKYVETDTYNNWFRNGHPKQQDILISTVGSLAEMKLFYGDKGCIAQNVVGFRSKGISPLYLYQYLKYIKSDLISYNIGSVQPSIKVTHIIKHKILMPCDNQLKSFEATINEISSMLFKNFEETQILTDVRDTLLPKLMSGEIRVPLNEVQ